MLAKEVPSGRQVLTTGGSSLPTELYDPRAFITHAAWLDQGCPHCPIFPTAASRRSLGRVSVPVWLIILSDQLRVFALVGRYPTNKLMRRGLLLRRQPKPAFFTETTVSVNVCGISNPFGLLSPAEGQITHVLLTRPPLY